ncbi:MAG: DNA internalization-related competence protein ComEC/Rec2 [Dehalococcoidia bacterium]|nr:DNA internalization-related competence protein ComEC/Rec2 [Dehalococcoidia bacterium]
MPLILLSAAWVVGIYLGTRFDLPLVLLSAGLVPLPLLLFLKKYRKFIVITSLSLLALFTASWYAYQSLHVIDVDDLRYYNDRGTIDVRGIIARDPEISDRSTRLYFSVSETRTDGEWQSVEGNALLIVPRVSTYKYGDRLQVTGEMETPPQLNDFDYRGYLAHQGIYSTILYPDIEIEARGLGFKPLSLIYELRASLAQTLARALPEPQASLAQGIILGIRENIPPSVKNDFARTGTAHLLAISGLHLGIVAGIMLSLGIWLFGRRYYLYVWLAIATIWLYALLTGMHPPVIRGAIMGTLFLTAELLGRQRSAITALTFAAAIMVGISPYILEDAAFQLSFLAMAGLVFLFPSFRSLGRRAISKFIGEEGAIATAATFAGDSLSVTMAAIIAVWPVVAYYFGIISFAGPLATFLLLPALPAVILVGAASGVIGLIFLPVGQAVGWLAWLFLSYMLVIASWLASSPLAFIEVDPIAPAWLWLYYAGLTTAIILGRKLKIDWISKATAGFRSGASRSANAVCRLPVKWVLPLLATMAVLVSVIAASMPDDELSISFLDVGQGDAILIQQGSQQVLIDGGPSPQAISLELGRQMPFWDRTIELVILTHPDQDHLAGLIEVLKRYRVEKVLDPNLDSGTPLYEEWQRLVTEKELERITALAGQQIALGEATLTVLHPPEALLKDTDEDIDNNGVVLCLKDGNVSFMLAADIRREAELHLITRRAALKSTVLKVAHHGSDTSTSQEFLSAVDPQIAVLSVGADNKFGHPGDEVVDRLENKLGRGNIYRTDHHGTIQFTTDGEKLWVRILGAR